MFPPPRNTLGPRTAYFPGSEPAPAGRAKVGSAKNDEEPVELGRMPRSQDAFGSTNALRGASLGIDSVGHSQTSNQYSADSLRAGQAPVVAPTIFERLRHGSIPNHARAIAALEDFSPAEEKVLKRLVDEIIDALGAIFPPKHNDLLIVKRSLPKDFARTIFYGKEATIELNLDAHLSRGEGGKRTLDEAACARIAQTLTHEIVLHTRKEFEEYFSSRKISRTGHVGHKEACMPDTRAEYLTASYLVSRRLSVGARPAFASAWRKEMRKLVSDSGAEFALSSAQRAEFQRWVTASSEQLSN
jgi:hypothetical protein